MTFLDRLNLLMAVSGINKSKLSQISGVPYTTIDGFYKKGYQNAKISTIRKLANAFGVSLDYLIVDENTESIAPQIVPQLSEEAAQLAAAYDRADEKSRSLVRIALAEYVQTARAESDLATPAMSHTPLSEEEIEEDVAAFSGLLKGVQTIQNLPDAGMKPSSNSTSTSGESGQSGKAG